MRAMKALLTHMVRGVRSSLEYLSSSRKQRRRNGGRYERAMYKYLARTLTDTHAMLRISQRSFAAGRQPHASSETFVRIALKAIAYVRAFAHDTIKHVVAHESRDCGDDEANNFARMLTVRIYRKCVSSMCRLYVEQVLRARALALQDRRLSITGDCDATLLLCHVCKRTFDKTFHYLQHIRVHYKLNMYACGRCGETFVQQNGLNYHANRCDRSRRRRCVNTSATVSLELCESCCLFFDHGSQLRNHVLFEHALMNIDLGLNRTQQCRMEQLLTDMEYK